MLNFSFHQNIKTNIRKNSRGERRKGEDNRGVSNRVSEREKKPIPARNWNDRAVDLPWQLRTTSCQMMGRVLINNTGSDWLPVPAVLEFDIQSRARSER